MLFGLDSQHRPFLQPYGRAVVPAIVDTENSPIAKDSQAVIGGFKDAACDACHDALGELDARDREVRRLAVQGTPLSGTVSAAKDVTVLAGPKNATSHVT